MITAKRFVCDCGFEGEEIDRRIRLSKVQRHLAQVHNKFPTVWEIEWHPDRFGITFTNVRSNTNA